jgi:hypothetical protein
VTHSYRITVFPVRPMMWLACRIFPQHTDMRPQMLQNLEALRRQTKSFGTLPGTPRDWKRRALT